MCLGADNSRDGLGAYRTYLGVNHRIRYVATVLLLTTLHVLLRPLMTP